MSGLKTPRGYQEDFDADWYLDTYYKTIEGEKEEGGMLPFFVDSLHEIFASGTIRGEKLLDIGTGPAIFSVISASRHVTEIHLSDFTDKNREVLQKWLEGASNVTPVFEYLKEKENDGSTLEARVQAVREKVKKIYPIDLLKPTPIKELHCTYDVITTSLCLESVARSVEEYTQIVSKIADMLSPGGHLVVVGVLSDSFYRVGDFKFPCLNISGDDLKTSVTKAGFDIKIWREASNKDYKPHEKSAEYSDFEGFFALVGQKNSK